MSRLRNRLGAAKAATPGDPLEEHVLSPFGTTAASADHAITQSVADATNRLRKLGGKSPAPKPSGQANRVVSLQLYRRKRRALVFASEQSVRDQLTTAIAKWCGYPVAAASTVAELSEALIAQHHVLVAIDIDFPAVGPETTFSLLEDAATMQPSSPIYAVSAFMPWLSQSLGQYGVTGVLGKPFNEFELARTWSRSDAAIPAAAQPPAHYGEVGMQLSPREFETLVAIAHGYSVTDIARVRQRSLKTVSTQKIAALAKVGFANDPALIRYFTKCQFNIRD